VISLDLINDVSSKNPTPRTPLQAMRKDDWRYEEAPTLDNTFITKYLQPEPGRTAGKQPLMKVLSERNLKVYNSGGKQSCKTPRLIKKVVADKENI
jgi:hypothetical protein